MGAYPLGSDTNIADTLRVTFTMAIQCTEEAPGVGSNDGTANSGTTPVPFSVMIEQRCKEYAARLPPIRPPAHDLRVLSPALRPFALVSPDGKHPSLHLGFQCPSPRDVRSAGNYVDEVTLRIERVNEEVEAEFGSQDWHLTHLPTVTDRPLDWRFIVAAFYGNVNVKFRNILRNKEKIDRIRQALGKAFQDGEVKGPEWYWGLLEHGAAAHNYLPFDQAYPNGHPGAC